MQLASTIERSLAKMMFHSAAPLYLIDICANIEFKGGKTTESGVLDGYIDALPQIILSPKGNGRLSQHMEPCAPVLTMQTCIYNFVDAS